MHGQAGQVATSDQNTEGQTAEQIQAELEAHTIPGALVIPAAVAELVRLQDKGYRLVVNA